MAATKKRSKKKHSFAAGLFLYALILLVIVAVGLGAFYVYIDTYEQTRPTTAAKEYVDRLTVDHVMETAVDSFAFLDGNLQDQGELRSFVSEKLQNLSYARQFDSSDSESYVYALESGEEIIGSFALAETGETRLGFAELQVSEESFDWTAYGSDRAFTVPAEYSVVCNGFTLDKSYVETDDVHYQLLEQFYDDGYELPTMWTYRTGKTIGQVEVAILDENGQPVDEADLNEKFFTDNCTAEEKERVTAFMNEYITRYVQYLSGVQYDALLGYYRTAELVLQGSDLQSRLYQAIGGQGFASSRSDEIQSITINEIMNVGNGAYVCDVTYLVETLGQADYVTTTNNSRVVMVETEQGLRASSQASY